MIPKRKTQRAFTGLVGAPPDSVQKVEPTNIPRRFTGLAGSPLAKVIEFPGYDPEKYRKEIDKALGYAAVQLVKINRHDYGRILLNDLRRIIDFELWQAVTNLYRDKMT